MAITHATVADGTFSTAGATNWDAAHSITGMVTLAAGTTGTGGAPLKFQSGSLETAPDAGDMEYDGKVLYFTPLSTQRGAIPCEQILVQSAAYTLTSQTTTQKLFNASTNGAVTVSAATTYLVECFFTMSGMSATSGNTGFNLVGGGTATVTSAALHCIGLDGTAGTAAAAGASFITSQGQTGNIITAATGAAMGVLIKGIIRINAGGTLIPAVTLTTAAAAVVGANSYLRITPIGSNTGNILIGAWS